MNIQNNLTFKIANIDEVKEKWDYEIKIHPENLLYYKAANEFINEIKNGTRISYIAKLNNKIICDLTVIVKEKGILNEAKYYNDLVSDKRVFLCGLRTIKEYQGKGYFSKFYKYVENDLKEKGYKEISLSVNIKETKNLMMYFKWNYTNYIRTEIREGKKDTFIFNYYYKNIDI